MKIERCRVCHSSELTPVKDLGEYQHRFIGSEDQKLELFPLQLCLCEDCLHLTLDSDSVLLPDPLFYSGETRTMRSFFRELSSKIEKRFHLKSKDLVLDIGSNDGTFLRTFDIPGLIKVGVEKSDALIDEAKTGLDYFIHGDWSSRSFDRVVGQKAKVIFALNVLEQNTEPLAFLRDVEASLRDDGIFVLQVTRAQDILENGDIGFISPIHLNYFSLHSLQKLLENAQLDVFDIEKVSVGGHGLRVYCRKKNSYVEGEGDTLSLEELLAKEKETLTRDRFVSFFSQMLQEKKALHDFIDQAHRDGRSIWLYGLTEGSKAILEFLKIDSTKVQGIYDWNEKRRGLIYPPLQKVIQGEAELLKAQPDYLLLTSYHFINEFYQQENELRRSGSSFILPFPKFRVVN